MVALVSVETVLLVLLVVLVAGLLRSHAELLRRLGPAGDEDAPIPEPVANRPKAQTAAAAISGTTLEGDPLRLDFAGGDGAPTLLAFLSSGCGACSAFWEALGDRRLPDGLQTLIVTKGAERERPARLRSLARTEVPVVMSSQAWTDYGVPGSPYFILVQGTIRGEGAAPTWEALASLIADAIEDQRQAPPARTEPTRARLVDERLAAAGIGPDHPSLYPADE